MALSLLFFILIINSINHDIKTLLNTIVADMHNDSPSAGISRRNPGKRYRRSLDREPKNSPAFG